MCNFSPLSNGKNSEQYMWVQWVRFSPLSNSIKLPSLHNRTHSKVEAWAGWSARPKIGLIATISLQQSG